MRKYCVKTLISHSNTQGNSPFLLENESAYALWRQEKLANFPSKISEITVSIKALDDFCVQQRKEILDLSAKANMVFYKVESEPTKETISDFAFLLGLHRLDGNLCAGDDAISSIQMRPDSELHKTYIPYSNKALSWHTDGYYNSSEKNINAFLMHCARTSESGGDNQFFDPEIMYILLRDDNPDSIAALMQTDVMSIPPNEHNGEEIRPVQLGPVFSIDSESACLHMRYSARKRNIDWKVEDRVQYALNKITEILNSGSEYCFKYTPTQGQGIIANNVLHNRSKIYELENKLEKEADGNLGAGRLIYRARFYDRLSRSE